MKKYNIQNYIRYKNDVETTIKRIPKKQFSEYTRNELVTTFLPSSETVVFTCPLSRLSCILI